MDPIYNIKVKTDQFKVDDEIHEVIIVDFDSYITNVTDSDLFHMYKFKIPAGNFDADSFEGAGGFITQYLNDNIYMGNQMFMGGYDIEEEPEIIDITNNIAQGSRRIIDSEVERGYTYVYQVIYFYSGKTYTFSVFANLESIRDVDEVVYNAMCMRNRNQERRAPVPHIRRNDDNIEIEQDLNALYNDVEIFREEIEVLKDDIELLHQVYDMEERISIILSLVDIFGYGLGRYGKDGTYGVTDTEE